MIKYTKTELQDALNTTKTYQEVLSLLNVPITNGNRNTLKRRIVNWQCDLTEHNHNRTFIDVECLNCTKQLTKKQNKFCGSSCAALFNNTKRTKASREKQKTTLLNTINDMDCDEYVIKYSRNQKTGNKNANYKHGKYEANKKCKVCGKSSGTNLTCSLECRTINRSLQATNALRKRRLRGENFSFRRVSKLERKFQNFLNEKKISYRQEVYVRNVYSTGYYRLDFVIKKKKLIIEIDGKQHERPTQLRHDVIRDFYLKERGWHVIRLNYYEVNKSAILEQVYNSYLK